jgi:crotonobetainyl-CoA:carnitine CoA-transferase CaiB-like acyl-CoA transferase
MRTLVWSSHRVYRCGAVGQRADRKGREARPLSLVGDFGGRSLLLLVGILAALLERIRSGNGQVVNAAMLDGAMMLDLFIAQHSAGCGAAVERQRIRSFCSWVGSPRASGRGRPARS